MAHDPHKVSDRIPDFYQNSLPAGRQQLLLFVTKSTVRLHGISETHAMQIASFSGLAPLFLIFHICWAIIHKSCGVHILSHFHCIDNKTMSRCRRVMKTVTWTKWDPTLYHVLASSFARFQCSNTSQDCRRLSSAWPASLRNSLSSLMLACTSMYIKS